MSVEPVIPRAGVIGWPVAHSRSPKLHGYWLKQYGLQGRYDRLPVPPEGLAEFIAALRAGWAEGFRGVNVTIPHKEAVMPFLDEIDPGARRIGAVNTITLRPDGSLHGRNTDAFGFIENLKSGAPGWKPRAAPAVVLGAGGSARAICIALLDEGVPGITLVNRSVDRAEALADSLSQLGGGPVSVANWAAAPLALEGAGLLVNTTSLGMAGQPALDLDLAPLPATAVVNDIVYVPLETGLLAQARERGHVTVDGLGMLLHQGRPGFESWFGVAPEVTPGLREAVLAD